MIMILSLRSKVLAEILIGRFLTTNTTRDNAIAHFALVYRQNASAAKQTALIRLRN